MEISVRRIIVVIDENWFRMEMHSPLETRRGYTLAGGNVMGRGAKYES
jgi:hypothetical protein